MEIKKLYLPPLKSEARIDSKINGVIRIKRFGDNIRGMIFGEDDRCYQSLYDISNLETIYLPYLNPLLTFLNHIDKFDNMLIVGLGGGQVPMLFADKFNVKIDIIELDSCVVTAAERMGFVKTDKMNVMVGNGADLLNLTLKQYDVIIIDLDKPESFDEFDFLDVKAGRLSFNGVLVINCGESDGREILLDKLTKHFKSVKVFQAYGQYVYICKMIHYDFRDSDKYMQAFANAENILNEAHNSAWKITHG